MTDRCGKTDLIVNQCAHCLGHQSIEEKTLALRATLLADPTWFAANFPGTCWGCGEYFAPGAAIQGAGLHLTGCWIAECCAPEEVSR